MLFLRQTWALTYKNLLIILFRHALSTPLRALVLPIVFGWFLSYARNLFQVESEYGFGVPAPVKSFADGLDGGITSRATVVFVNNGFTQGEIGGVIDNVADQARSAGKIVRIVETEAELPVICKASIRAVSKCYGAAIFYSSPNQGENPGQWNYTLKADGALGVKIDVTKNENDPQLYALPFQRAIDLAIASQNSTVNQSAIPTINEYPFTTETIEQRETRIRTSYMGGIIDILGVAFYIAVVGVIYQLVGLMASERELGMSQLIEASMPNEQRWKPQAIRLLANHLAFDIMFVPGWIAIGAIWSEGIFTETNPAIIVIFNILSGLSLSSFAIFGAAFFHKAQLSGIVTTIASLLLAVLAQVIGKSSTGAVAVLGILFPPMNYTFFTILIARWERQELGVNLVKAAPQNPSTLPGIAFFVFAIVQTLVFPILGAVVERTLYGTASKGRQLSTDSKGSGAAVELLGFTKIYKPSWWAQNIAARFGKTKETVTAVNDLNLAIPQGQIMVLLGANGSGKSTTLDAIAGLNTVTSGSIAVDGQGGLGMCPQRNVLWDVLTAYEHVKIFNQLKSTGKTSSGSEIRDLIADCDLDRKVYAQAHTLSGGQKRKLQLSMMFTGGSRVCCVDECSSGVDALARQKLWSILLNERGKRTIIFTTHFLDEADLLSDQLAILSRGNLKAQGSAVELKQRLGGGYRIHVFKVPGREHILPPFEGPTKDVFDRTIFELPTSTQAAEFVRTLEAHGIKNYEITSPTLEEIFFNVADNAEVAALPQTSMLEKPQSSGSSNDNPMDDIIESKNASIDNGLKLQTGKRIGLIRQITTLVRKRWTVLQRNYLPYVCAFLIPVIAAGLVTLFTKNAKATSCNPGSGLSDEKVANLLTQSKQQVVVGPASKFTPEMRARIAATLPGSISTPTGGEGSGTTEDPFHTIEGTFDDFNSYILQNRMNVTPGGFWLGDDSAPPTIAYIGDPSLSRPIITQNFLDTILFNVSISTQYQPFGFPFTNVVSKTLQLVIYFGLAMSAYPAFFALYPTIERLRSVRQLHYSNGVRSISLWSAYLIFDFATVLAVSVLAVVIFRGVTDIFYHPEYLFVVFFLYGIASTLLSYCISLFARSQLAAFAFAAGGQAVGFLVYFIAYLSVLTYAAVDKVDDQLQTVHFIIALITPAGNLIRALFVGLNVFSTLCQGQGEVAKYPGKITLYGGPILYLIGQSLVLFGILLWYDSASIWARIRRSKYKAEDAEEVGPLDTDIAAEIKRVTAAPDDGLRVQHITKAYGSNVAVQDITFGVKHGEVFALLGPNGAGKSTTISLIRGDIDPSHSSGQIYVENLPLSSKRAAARMHLGVCPQVDACDQMTVLEHLRFYARVRGVDDVEHDVREVIRGVGLGPFQHRMAAALSGGNKRKLSLAIALMGNPSVLLLDEPSSGMDVVAKRVMWRTLTSIVPGRSLVLTTHSMEEADALADRAGILGKKMLALGTSESLRKKHGDRYHVHLIMRTAPHTSDLDMDNIKSWIRTNLEGAEVEDKTYHGQLRFSVPARHASSSGTDTSRGGVGEMFTLLESKKEELDFEYFSVSQTTLDQVFLSIVGKHNIEEENVGSVVKKRSAWRKTKDFLA